MANEKRLIDANKLEARMGGLCDEFGTDHLFIDAIVYEIGNAPDVDAVEVKHGEWFVIEDDYFDLVELKCSACGESWRFEDYEDCIPQNYNYCPNCGADMRERKDNG